MAEKKTSFGTTYVPISEYKKTKNGFELAADPSSLPARVQLFISVGLAQKRAEETDANDALSALFQSLIESAGGAPMSKTTGTMLYDIAAKIGTGNSKQAWLEPHGAALVAYAKAGSISSKTQLDAAFAYIKKNGKSDGAEFKEAAGVGIVITDEDIKNEVASTIAASKETVLKDRYKVTFKILGSIREKLKWADGSKLKNEVDAQLLALLGPKTEVDTAKTKVKKVKATKVKKASGATTADEKVEDSIFRKFHKPGMNYTTNGYQMTDNTMAHMAAHLKRTGGGVRTRFPPEPNGVLHIGHAKAINFNFSFAAKTGGSCLLRYDDTNPEKEEERFFTGILENVKWLGHTPSRVTHSSDYFQELFDFAVKLINEGQAYICHQDASELKGQNVIARSPWRDRPIEESLTLFNDMKNGKIDEGKATLRMKHIMGDGKVDPVAYRIKFVEHHRTKDTWCIYPTYDYTHCLVDSMEDISHSLCTKEFQIRRPSYYWLCNAVDTYCPVQWEYSRLNVSYTVISKRKIAKLIEGGACDDWDDPRLWTLSALRRRGFPPQAVANFCDSIGVTEATETVINPSAVEACVREVMEATCSRQMVVLDPIRVEFLETQSDYPSSVTVPNLPHDEKAGSHNVSICKVIYISRDDFENGPASPGYKRLALNQTVGLKHISTVATIKDVVMDGDKVVGVKAIASKLSEAEVKPKAFIHWVSSVSPTTPPVNVEIKVYEKLFKHPNPEEQVGGFMADIAENSLTVYPDALADASISGAKVGDSFQFERTGFFCVDKTSTPSKLTFNLTVGLKSGK